MPHEKGVELTIEGRLFVQESPTFEQELYIMEQATLAGLPEVGKLTLDPATQSLTGPVQQMIIRAYKSGALFRLMAALVTEQGTEWTPEAAEANAEFFKHVRDPESKAQLQPALVAAILAFFESAASSDLTSLISSDPSVSKSGLPDSEHVSVRPNLTPEQAAAVFHSGRLPTSSEKSRSRTASTR